MYGTEISLWNSFKFRIGNSHCRERKDTLRYSSISHIDNIVFLFSTSVGYTANLYVFPVLKGVCKNFKPNLTSFLVNYSDQAIVEYVNCIPPNVLRIKNQ
jgi:hypothetical protein